MSKIDPLSSISSGYAGALLLDANFTKIAEALTNTVSRDGSTPNDMDADFDMNGHQILNLPTAVDPSDPVRLDQLDTLAVTAAEEYLASVDINTITAATECICVAVTDETSNITTGLAKVTFRMPYAFTLTAIPRGSLTASSASGTFVVDINESGTSILSTKLSLDVDEKTSTTAATPAVLSDTALANDAEITIDVDSAGTGAKGLKVYLIGRKAS